MNIIYVNFNDHWGKNKIENYLWDVVWDITAIPIIILVNMTTNENPNLFKEPTQWISF